jgi:DNA-binding NarL/FixJ family response regulator
MVSNKKINIIIADDHNLFRKGLMNLLSEFKFVGKIYEASNGLELINLLKSTIPLPDVVLLDINMPVMDGIEATEKIRKLYSDLKIIVLTMEDNEQFVLHMIENGINGYLLKNCEPEDLGNALKSVMVKEFYFNDDISELIRNAYVHQIHPGKNKQEVTEFTNRELEVLKLICKEFNSHEIAKKLFVSPRTVEAHRKNMIEKAGVKNIAGLIVYAIKNKFVEI